MSQNATDLDRWRLAELGQHAAMLVHQLRQPLFTIRGLVQLAESDPARAALHLATAQGQLDVMESLVDGWADFSRRPGQADERFDIRAPVESALVLLRHRGHSLGVAVESELGPGLVVRSSLLGVQQAVVNLGQNALEALDGQPQARLSLRVDGAAIVVEDNGPGLPRTVHEDLFRPFVTTKAKGTGLGLVIARTLLEGCGGHLHLEEARSGVRWRIVLPAAA
ncbi:MAG: hypothetical protein EXR71_15440 [Myxococcales bacterium]|nr:hypothetical protein [Myxococcales bacterium]